MNQGLFFATFVMSLLLNHGSASGEAAGLFVDGRWNGGIGTAPDSKGVQECWARTTFSDGTVFTLAKGGDGNWRLRLSNSGWRLPPSSKYAMVAQVDFYPQLQVAAEAWSETGLEIANLEQAALLKPIENGHTIELKSASLSLKYDLEGSAKAIERVRNCAVH